MAMFFIGIAVSATIYLIGKIITEKLKVKDIFFAGVITGLFMMLACGLIN